MNSRKINKLIERLLTENNSSVILKNVKQLVLKDIRKFGLDKERYYNYDFISNLKFDLNDDLELDKWSSFDKNNGLKIILELLNKNKINHNNLSIHKTEEVFYNFYINKVRDNN